MRILIVLTSFFLLFSCQKKAEKETAKFDIFLIGGQSNTQNGFGIDSSIDKVSNGVLQLGRHGNNNLKIIEAKDPLEHWDPRVDRNGFGLTFAKLYQNDILDKNRKVLLIPCGKGNTGFIDQQWNKGNVCFDDAIARVDWVLENYKGSQLKAILWQQAERDILLNNLNYKTDLDQFVSDVFQSFPNQNFYFLAGGMVPYWVNLNPRRIAFQNIIKTLPDRHSKTEFIDSEIPFIISKMYNNFDTVHYNAFGQREMGKRYFSIYKKLAE